MKVKEFIGAQGEQQIVKAIKEAELNTSGEIRVHIESKCASDPLQRAVYIFNYLKMYNTQARNGVLIYVAVESRKFAIIGDVYRRRNLERTRCRFFLWKNRMVLIPSSRNQATVHRTVAFNCSSLAPYKQKSPDSA